jgi:hypothetical protein
MPVSHAISLPPADVAPTVSTTCLSFIDDEWRGPTGLEPGRTEPESTMETALPDQLSESLPEFAHSPEMPSSPCFGRLPVNDWIRQAPPMSAHHSGATVAFWIAIRTRFRPSS